MAVSKLYSLTTLEYGRVDVASTLQDAGTAMKEYEEFWPHFLCNHSKPATRNLHVFGTTLAAGFLVYIFITNSWLQIWVVLVLGYVPAWFSHKFIEGNTPTTFEAPFFALFADIEMTVKWWTSRLRRELVKHGVEETDFMKN